MKSVLYVGATLMIGASIYGFVDYKKTQHKEGFKTMYTEVKEPVTEPIAEKVVTENKLIATNNTSEAKTVAEKKKTVPAKKIQKKIKKKRKISTRLFSRGGLDDRLIESEKRPTKLPEISERKVILEN
jgi:uncharacterized protein HemX